MRLTLHRFLAIALTTALALQLASCGSAPHLRGPGYDPDRGVVLDGVGDTVWVALTAAFVADGQSTVFIADTQRVLASLPAQPGLIGWSMRGDPAAGRAWTMSVWRDEESLEDFMLSRIHRDAVRNGRVTLEKVDFRRIEWPTESVPPSWDEAFELLEEPSRTFVPTRR